MTDDARDISLDQVHVGDTAETIWHVSASEIEGFAELSGDQNPLHTDEIYARQSGFGGCVAHGFLIGAKLSGVIGMKLPGRRCLLLEQRLAFPNPVYAGDTIALAVEVRNVHAELNVIELKATAEKRDPAGTEPQKVARGIVTCKILS